MDEKSYLSLAEYIDATLDTLSSFAGEEASNTLREILHQVCQEDTVFPALEFDGAYELTASWHVEGSSLCITVSQHKEAIAHCTWRHPNIFWPLPHHLPEVQQCLHDLSAYVRRHNLGRELFAC